MLSSKCHVHLAFRSSLMLPRSLSFFSLAVLPPHQVAWLQDTELAAARGFCPLALPVPLKALQKAGKAASSSSLAEQLLCVEQPGLRVQEPSGQPWLLAMAATCGVGPVHVPGVISCLQPKRGVHPVVGRIRTCAGKPQWISSPSPSPLGHNYLLQPSLPCSSHSLGHHTDTQALQAKAPATNE